MNLARISVSLFVLLWIFSMGMYPGGNPFDSNSKGHGFFVNFLCDVLSATAKNGESNLFGSLAANLGVLVLVFGALLPLWWQVPVPVAWRTASRVLGASAAILILVICLEQAFSFQWPHHAITLLAGAAGILPTILVAVADWRAPDSTLLRRALLLGTLTGSLTNFVSYSLVQLGGPLTPVVPIAQKVALIFLLVWLIVKPANKKDSHPLKVRSPVDPTP